MQLETDAVIAQIDAALKEVDGLRARAKHHDLSDLPDEELLTARTRCAAAIERLAPNESSYRVSAVQAVNRFEGRNPGAAARELAGILRALRADYGAGYLRSVEELIHADVFADFLEMATHLLEAGYKDPAAVLAGSVLEEHLRKLADRNGVATHNATGRPRKADALNADLVKQGAYNKLQQKAITAWLGLRNDAAHGITELRRETGRIARARRSRLSDSLSGLRRGCPTCAYLAAVSVLVR